MLNNILPDQANICIYKLNGFKFISAVHWLVSSIPLTEIVRSRIYDVIVKGAALQAMRRE